MQREKVAQLLASVLIDIAEDYHHGYVSHAQFAHLNRAAWDFITSQGVAQDVTRLIANRAVQTYRRARQS